MKTILITIGGIFILVGLIKFASASISKIQSKNKIIETVSHVLKPNDKIIIIDNVDHDLIKKALNDFCKIYNKKDNLILPRLYQVSKSKFIITFPYDIDIPSFCFLINYLKYPTNIKWDANVRAWATTHQGDEWITDKSVNKNAMFFLAVDDKEYDNVFLTTQNNIGYKLGFAVGEEKKLLATPKEKYVANTFDMNKLKSLKFEDFK
jgi:hypothetical protein